MLNQEILEGVCVGGIPWLPLQVSSSIRTTGLARLAEPSNPFRRMVLFIIHRDLFFQEVIGIHSIPRFTYMIQPWQPKIQVYLTARERFEKVVAEGDNCRIILNSQLRLVVERGADMCRENLPTADEVSMILPEEYGSKGFRDIVLARRSNGADDSNLFTLINPSHAAYLPLQYVLLFPFGEKGCHWGMTLLNREGQRQKNELSQRMFYRFRLHTRGEEPATLFQAQRLFQQFVVDAWAVVDQSKLSSTDEDFPFILERTQFPDRPCFAMTVNKSQGQSVKMVGVDLQTNAFTHGQLYLALSRVTSLDGLTLLTCQEFPNHTEKRSIS